MWPALMRNLWGAVRYWWQMADNFWHKSFIPKLIHWHKSSFPKLILWHISSIQNLILCILGYVSLGHISVKKRERNEEEYIQFSARFPNKMLHSISLQFPALFAISNNCPQRCSSFNTCCEIQDFKKCFFPFFYQKTQVDQCPTLSVTVTLGNALNDVTLADVVADFPMMACKFKIVQAMWTKRC